MNCQYCGAEVKNRLGYCMQCGTRQEVPVREEKKTESPKAVCPGPVWQETVVADAEAPGTDCDDLGYCAHVPSLILPGKRGLGKMVFLGILTLGIYPLVIWSRMVTELNIAASRHDGKRTMPFLAMLLLNPLTFGIFGFVWMHKFCGRIGGELVRRGIRYRFGPRDFWLWNVLGILILAGPFVFVHKLMKAMNRINENFNSHG